MTGPASVEVRLDGSFVPAPVPGVESVDADGEAVLVDPATNRVHLLNHTAALLWSCFDGESSVADICFDLADALDIPFERVLADTLAVVSGLVAQGVLFDGRGAAPSRHEPHGDLSVDVPRHPRLLEEPPGG